MKETKASYQVLTMFAIKMKRDKESEKYEWLRSAVFEQQSLPYIKECIYSATDSHSQIQTMENDVLYRAYWLLHQQSVTGTDQYSMNQIKTDDHSGCTSDQ